MQHAGCSTQHAARSTQHTRVLQGLWKIGGCPPQVQPPRNFVSVGFLRGLPTGNAKACGVPCCDFCPKAHFACFCIKFWCGSTVFAEKGRNQHLLQAKSFVQPTNLMLQQSFCVGCPLWCDFLTRASPPIVFLQTRVRAKHRGCPRTAEGLRGRAGGVEPCSTQQLQLLLRGSF